MNLRTWCLPFSATLVMFCFFSSVPGQSSLRPDKIHVADAKKNNFYIKDGLFTGGDRAIDHVLVKDIRRGPNKGFERIVIELQGLQNGEPAAIQRAPYYQVAVTPDERRVVVTLWGHPKIEFDSKKVLAGFKKSQVAHDLVMFPTLEDESWTFAFALNPGYPVEVWELSDPVRIVMDIRTKKK